MRHALLLVISLLLSPSFAADASRAPTARIVFKDKQSVVHLVPAAAYPWVWLGFGHPNSALLTMTDLESGRMSIPFRPSFEITRAKDWRDWANTTVTYLDGVVCDDEHIVVFIITNSHSSTTHVQNLMNRDEISYSISVYARDNGKLLSTLTVHPKLSSQRRQGREQGELMKNPAGPLALTRGGVTCFDRLFVIEGGKLKENR
ncbi:MAG TPA: hypothetical protein VMY42_18955 [Thermoguttaceae bacterium]|nr:hypothetical protein [Thermoguttaceae bacterium]